ncbi:Glycosyltransferase [Rhynchospora pubera]|uniref:Glycosyltransferases n=1 Tax=Rhynchospora pubera TaxID=906938 RepID=A0AAV8DR79_9POAL|nr:Glycosyltransferase [Rhynchospora pubera]
MRSSRRNSGLIQREGSANKFQEFLDNSPSPKLSPSKTILALRGLLSSFPALLDCLPSTRSRSGSNGNLAQRYQRSKGFKWKRALFNFVVCFILGIFIGFTPFFSINIPENIPSHTSALNFGRHTEDKNIKHSSHSITEELVVRENPQIIQNSSLEELEVVKEDEPKVELPKEEFVKELPKEELPKDNLVELPREESVNVELPKIDQKDVRKLLIIVTTTHVRPFQAYYLNRLAHTLSAVPKPLLWIVVDRYYQSMETAQILMSTGLMYRHFACMMNVTSMRKMINCQRNIAIYHIKKHHINGIVYFADDDGVYSLELFEEMRKIRRFGAWPVATFQDPNKRLLLEGPSCNGKRVIGWHSNQNSRMVRRFRTSISGFAFNSTMIWDSKKFRRHPKSIIFHSTGKESMQDSKFVELLVEDERQMEGLGGNNCTKIMVWRNGLEAPQLDYPSGWSLGGNLGAVIALR